MFSNLIDELVPVKSLYVYFVTRIKSFTYVVVIFGSGSCCSSFSCFSWTDAVQNKPRTRRFKSDQMKFGQIVLKVNCK